MKLPFGFYGAGDLKLPVVTNLNANGVTANSMQLTALLAYEGTETPLTDVGFIYSDTNADPEIGGPGVAQISLFPLADPAPTGFQTTVAGLNSTTNYYIKAYATNQEGTSYTPVKSQETNWDALTIEFLSSGSSNHFLMSMDNFSPSTQVKIKMPDDTVQTSALGSGNIYVNLTGFTGEITLAIAPNDGQTFEGFRFYQTATAYANPKILHWGPNKWKNLYQTFAGSNVYSYADDHPDLSDCNDLRYCFWARDDIFQNGNTFVNGQGQTSEDIADWDVSNVSDFSYMFYEATDLGRYDVLDIPDWDLSNGTSLNGMFYMCTNMGEIFGNPVPDGGLNIENWTLNQDPTSHIDMTNMFTTCVGWRPGAYPGKGDIFDLNAATPSTSINLNQTFMNAQHLCSVVSSNTTNLGGWITKIGALTSTNSAGSEMKLTDTFRSVGVPSSNLYAKIDFTGIDLGRFDEIFGLFSNYRFDPNAPGWATMLTGQDWSGNLTQNKRWSQLFYGAKNVPPLDNWVFDGVKYMDNLFGAIQYDTTANPGYILDLQHGNLL